MTNSEIVGKWRLDVTERVHQMREEMTDRYATPQWILGAVLTSLVDHELLRVRGRYAYAMPGVEVH